MKDSRRFWSCFAGIFELKQNFFDFGNRWIDIADVSKRFNVLAGLSNLRWTQISSYETLRLPLMCQKIEF